jgi:hypothetical protein
MKTTITWAWDEAFSKFGFGDGDEANFTSEVAAFINSKGYECNCDTWGIHNYMIMEIFKEKKGVRTNIMQFPKGHPKFGQEPNVGYDDPREYLPKALVKALDKEFGKLSCFI